MKEGFLRDHDFYIIFRRVLGFNKETSRTWEPCRPSWMPNSNPRTTTERLAGQPISHFMSIGRLLIFLSVGNESKQEENPQQKVLERGQLVIIPS